MRDFLFSIACIVFAAMIFLFFTPFVIIVLIHLAGIVGDILVVISEFGVSGVHVIFRCKSKIQNFQSIFQLGAALSLTMTITGPQAKYLVKRTLDKISLLLLSIDAMKNADVKIQDIELKEKILLLLDAKLQRAVADAEMAAPGLVGYYLVITAINILFLLVTSFSPDYVIANSMGAILCVYTLLPPLFVPIDLYRRIFPAARFVREATDFVNTVRPFGQRAHLERLHCTLLLDAAQNANRR